MKLNSKTTPTVTAVLLVPTNMLPQLQEVRNCSGKKDTPANGRVQVGAHFLIFFTPSSLFMGKILSMLLSSAQQLPTFASTCHCQRESNKEAGKVGNTIYH